MKVSTCCHDTHFYRQWQWHTNMALSHNVNTTYTACVSFSSSMFNSWAKNCLSNGATDWPDSATNMEIKKIEHFNFIRDKKTMHHNWFYWRFIISLWSIELSSKTDVTGEKFSFEIRNFCFQSSLQAYSVWFQLPPSRLWWLTRLQFSDGHQL